MFKQLISNRSGKLFSVFVCVCVSYWSMLLSKLKLLLGLLSTSGGRVWMETEHSHYNIEQRRMNEG